MANRDLPPRAGPLRPALRARRLRRRLRRRPARPPEPRDGPQGHHRALQPRPPGRGRRRDRHRRRRRDPPPDPGRVPPRGRGLRAPRGRCLRDRHRVPPQGPRRRGQGRRRHRRDRRRRGPAPSSAGATSRPTTRCSAPPRSRRCRRSARCSSAGDGLAGLAPGAARVHRAQADRARGGDRPPTSARLRLLPEPLVPDPRLQGHAHDAAARGVLRRPARRAGRERARARALAVLHQHVPVVAARAPVPLLAHNGEINTVQGNRNWMRAREALLASDLFPGELDRVFPICTPGRVRLGVASTKCSSCSRSAAGRCRTRS